MWTPVSKRLVNMLNRLVFWADSFAQLCHHPLPPRNTRYSSICRSLTPSHVSTSPRVACSRSVKSQQSALIGNLTVHKKVLTRQSSPLPHLHKSPFGVLWKGLAARPNWPGSEYWAASQPRVVDPNRTLAAAWRRVATATVAPGGGCRRG